MKQKIQLELRRIQIKTIIYKLLIGAMVESGTDLSSPLLLELNHELDKCVLERIELRKKLKVLKINLYIMLYRI